MSVWAYRGQHPEAHTIANDYCTTISRGHNKAVAAAHDFSQLRTVMVLHDWHDDQSEGAPAND